MKVLFCFADSSIAELNTSLHRVIYPMKMMQEAGHTCWLTHASSLFTPLYKGDRYGLENWNKHVLVDHGVQALYGEAAYDAMRSCEVAVIERLITHELWTTVDWLKVMGKRVYCTFDDGYHLMPLNYGLTGPQRNWRGGKDVREGKGAILYEFREGLKRMTGALVPSRLLADDYRRYQPNMKLVPNYLYPPLWSDLSKKHPDQIIIGYGASDLHTISLKESGVIPALKMIGDKYSRVTFHLQPPRPEIVKILEMTKVRSVYGNFQKFADWPKTVSRFNIGIAPLAGEYDYRRSSLKAIEYATAGVPWVATEAPPFEGCKGGIFVKNTKKDWFVALERLVLDEALYQRLSQEGLAWAAQFNSQCAARYEEVLHD